MSITNFNLSESFAKPPVNITLFIRNDSIQRRAMKTSIKGLRRFRKDSIWFSRADFCVIQVVQYSYLTLCLGCIPAIVLKCTKSVRSASVLDNFIRNYFFRQFYVNCKNCSYIQFKSHVCRNISEKNTLYITLCKEEDDDQSEQG